ncbi:MAG TPA: nucleotidyltransferase domain-containing protein [Candidatus Angelobacter sp.]|nr:nucleotidyltransferase domain-containing protein [Candidatus Angelobacter sp.]
MASEQTSAHEQALLNDPVLSRTRASARKQRRKLDQILTDEVSPPYTYASDTASLVVFGSLARGEWTGGSDLDWTYLVDGQANSDHLRIAQEIGRVLKNHGEDFRPPGQTGTFGNLSFSHEIVHQIGGQADTNKNTTQRVLLLLESAAIGSEVQAYERVIRAVINRYLEEDTHPLTEDGKAYRVPRFLLNDIVRFWRTMAVDFASKQRDRGGKGWGLRNAKLRMSRKLIFASGLLLCFSCHLDPKLQATISTANDVIKQNLVNHIREFVRQSPLEILAHCLPLYSVSEQTQRDFFAAYSDFLALLDDEKSREHLEQLRAEDSGADSTFKKVKEISSVFQGCLDKIFFDNPSLGPLIRKYGVF